MFWARTAALAPCSSSDWIGKTIPGASRPGAGTILHAIERLVTLVARHRGFQIAATHVLDRTIAAGHSAMLDGERCGDDIGCSQGISIFKGTNAIPMSFTY